MIFEMTPKTVDLLYDWSTDKMVEIKLKDPDDFLKVRETLTRIGILSKRPAEDGRQVLTQTCHLLHKRGKYYIMHFKELFCLDGRESDLTISDIERRNLVVGLLSEWGLISVVDQSVVKIKAPISALKVVPHKEKTNFIFKAKYQVGNKR